MFCHILKLVLNGIIAVFQIYIHYLFGVVLPVVYIVMFILADFSKLFNMFVFTVKEACKRQKFIHYVQFIFSKFCYIVF